MKKLKPYHVFLGLLGVVAILALVSWFTPTEGWKIAGAPLKFLTPEKFLHPKTQEKADISEIVAGADTSLAETSKPLIKHAQDSTGKMGAASGGELNIDSASVLHLNSTAEKALHTFFGKLKQAAASEQKIHILHYGDSQIEGDRMTGFIRQRMQHQFGGNGPGLIPANNVYSTISFQQTYSENFMRFTCFGGEKLRNKKYGVMGSAARFTPEWADSLIDQNTAEKQTAWITIEPSKNTYNRARKYSTVKLFYTSCVRPCLVNVYQDGNIIHQAELIPDGGAHTLTLSFAETPTKLKYEFVGKYSPTISNFSLEGDIGVQVSNIALRGSSGTIFGKLDRGVAKQVMNELNTELIIMQFGGNSVPIFRDSAHVRRFVGYFKGQLRTLKSMRPNAAIVVIGPSDMSQLTEDGIYETYTLLPYFVDEMKEGSLAVGAGYWDLYAAMGGKNAMPAWVEQNLAGSDYIHFSIKGARIAAQLFYNSLMNEYVKWKQ